MMKVLGLWALGCVLFFLALVLGVGCGAAQKAAPPAERVDTAMWCFGATVGGQELVTCSPEPALCEAARKATEPSAETLSEACLPIRVQLDHRAP
jgi:hypothetical protein